MIRYNKKGASWLCLGLAIYILITILFSCSSRKKNVYHDQEKAIMDSVAKHSSVNLRTDTSKIKSKTHLVQSDSSVDELTIYPHAGTPISFKFNLPDLSTGSNFTFTGRVDSIKHKSRQHARKALDQEVSKQAGKSQETRKDGTTTLKKQFNKNTGGKTIERKGTGWPVYLLIGLALLLAVAIAALRYFKIFPFNIKLPAT